MMSSDSVSMFLNFECFSPMVFELLLVMLIVIYKIGSIKILRFIWHGWTDLLFFSYGWHILLLGGQQTWFPSW